MAEREDSADRQCRDEAAADTLPHPVGTIKATAQELEVLIAHHNGCAQMCGAQREQKAEAFHLARSTYLLEQLAGIAPERVSPHKAERS